MVRCHDLSVFDYETNKIKSAIKESLFLFSRDKLILNKQVKVVLSPSKKDLYYLLHWKPFKMMKNTFYFIIKGLFLLKTFKFLSWLFGHVGKTAWLER